MDDVKSFVNRMNGGYSNYERDAALRNYAPPFWMEVEAGS